MTNKKLRIAIFGAAGKMGGEIQKLATDSDRYEIVACFEADSMDHSKLSNADVAIDFTIARSSIINMEICSVFSVPLLIGTTGFNAPQIREIEEAAQKLVILWSANMSIGANLLAKLSKIASAALGKEFVVDIIESHHSNKVDSPSGTALMIGNGLKDVDVQYHSIRAAEIVGEHSVIFNGPDEQLILTHKATSRKIFASGALKAAERLVSMKPGKLYSFSDLI